MKNTGMAWGFAIALFLWSGDPVSSQTATVDAFDLGVEAVRAGEIHVAFEHFEPLAQAGDHRAQFNLATLLKAGRGKPQNYTEAMKWATLARIGGIGRAVALTEKLSTFVPEAEMETVRDEVQALLLGFLDEGKREAILQYAFFNLEVLPEPDFETALRWQLVAAALDIAGAADERNETAAQLTPDVILQVQRETTEFFQAEDLVNRFAYLP
jgi:hypothetical protein